MIECDLCGARKRNDESVVWIGRSWGHRVPMCADDCALVANPETCRHRGHLALCKRCERAPHVATMEPREQEQTMGRWRTGRKVGRTIYIQRGAEPSDDDELIGVMDTPLLAEVAVDAVNACARFAEVMGDGARAVGAADRQEQP